MLDAHMTAVMGRLVGLPVGRGVKPDGAGWQGPPGQSEFVGYGIVWRLGSKDIRHRDLDGNWDEARPSFHLRAVGATAQQADQMLDEMWGEIVQQPIVVDGYANVHMAYDQSFTTTRDDDTTPPEFYTGLSFQIWTQETS